MTALRFEPKLHHCIDWQQKEFEFIAHYTFWNCSIHNSEHVK